MKIQWTELAIERVGEIAEYISQDNPTAAERWVKKIFDLADSLKQHPDRFRHVPESRDPSHREIITGNYRIIYKTAPRVITIMTVRHFKQILPEEDLD